MNKRKGANHRNLALTRKEKQPHRGRKIILKFGFAGIVCFGLLYLWGEKSQLRLVVTETLEQSKFLSVNEVAVENCSPEIDETVQAVLDTVIGKKLYNIKAEEIASAMQILPMIRDVQVKRHLNGKVVIRLIERKPVALVQKDGKIGLVDEKGYIFPPKTGEIYEIPVLTGCGKNKEYGEKISSEDMKTACDLIGYAKDKSDTFSKQISQIDFSDSHQVVFTFQSSSVKFVVSRDDVTVNLKYVDKIKTMLTENIWDPSVVNLSHRDLAFLRIEENKI